MIAPVNIRSLTTVSDVSPAWIGIDNANLTECKNEGCDGKLSYGENNLRPFRYADTGGVVEVRLHGRYGSSMNETEKGNCNLLSSCQAPIDALTFTLGKCGTIGTAERR